MRRLRLWFFVIRHFIGTSVVSSNKQRSDFTNRISFLLSWQIIWLTWSAELAKICFVFCKSTKFCKIFWTALLIMYFNGKNWNESVSALLFGRIWRNLIAWNKKQKIFSATTTKEKLKKTNMKTDAVEINIIEKQKKTTIKISKCFLYFCQLNLADCSFLKSNDELLYFIFYVFSHVLISNCIYKLCNFTCPFFLWL